MSSDKITFQVQLFLNCKTSHLATRKWSLLYSETACLTRAYVCHNLSNLLLQSHGSFLTRNKATLDKISEMTKPATSNIGGPKDSRGFVFAQLSDEDKASGATTKTKKPPVS